MNIIPQLQSLIVPIDSVFLDTENANEAHDLDGIAASLKDLGQDIPIVCRASDRVVCSGNGRLIAAKTRLKWTGIAAVFVDDDKADFIRRAVAHNLLTRKSHFDDAALKKLLSSIDNPLDVPGIDNDFLASLDRIDYSVPDDLTGGTDGDGESVGANMGIHTVYFMLDNEAYHMFKRAKGDMQDNDWFLMMLEGG
jgi:hypothetical protein